MRCPYCGGLNSDQAQFCVRCGRDLSAKPPVPATTSRNRAPYPAPPQPSQSQPPYQNPRQPLPNQSYPRPTPPPSPYRQPQAAPPAQPMPSRATARRVAETPVAPAPVPVAPEAPAPFPPRTIQHLKALEQGALNYSLVSEEESVGRKKVIRILYQRCTPWQQMATLLKALRDHQSEKFSTIVVQGTYEQERSTYGFTNGQLQFDRQVRLGSQIMNRYQIDTGNGFEIDSVRVVLSE